MTPPSTTELKAGCKVNLFLAITSRRANGYHELETLFLPLPEPSDRLLVTRRDHGRGIELTASDPALSGPKNLVSRAYEAFARATGFAPPLSVHLDKRIPTGAGLGGGSSDAAAILRHLNREALELALPEPELARLALTLGADVPFFLVNEPAWAVGLGEELSPAELDLAGLSLVLACPEAHVSTAWAYQTWDERMGLAGGTGGEGHPARNALTPRPCGDKKSFCLDVVLLRNDFEQVVFPAFPELRRLKEHLLQSGASGAVMSGSGAALCALFRDERAARAATLTFKGPKTSFHVHHF